MQGPTEEADASASTENVVREGPDTATSMNTNGTVAVRRKAAKRTNPWDLPTGELILASPPPPLPQAEDIPATKKPRLEEPLSASADEAATHISSRDTAISLPAAVAAAATATTSDHAYRDLAKVTWSMGPWTPGEDAKLTSAVTNTSKKKWGQEYIIDWAAISAQVPDRTKKQSYSRWHIVLNPDVDRATELKGGCWTPDVSVDIPPPTADNDNANADPDTDTQANAVAARRQWTLEEDAKLTSAVNTGKNKYGNEYRIDWAAIAVLVPGRPKNHCHDRWRKFLEPSIDRTPGRIGSWTEDEDTKLKDAVQTHGGKNWPAIAALVPGRTTKQCRNRWHGAFNHSIALTAGREGKWTAVENSKLKDAVQTHGGNDWGSIAALIPGRTKKQCHSRWRDVLYSSIGRANVRTGK
jgi:hypothetical protein